MRTPLKIAIVGYGIAGIAAAIQLRRRGHVIEHYERRDAISQEGSGLLLQPPALRLLHKLGVGTDHLDRGARVHSFGAEDLHGQILTDIRYADHAPGSYAVGIQRAVLIQCLIRQDEGAERVQLGRKAVSVDAERGVLLFNDGSRRGPYDLIVAADGANSPLRNGMRHLVRHDRLYPSAALVACVDDPRGLAGDRLVQVFDSARHVAIWPVGRAGRGQCDQANISISVPLDHADSFRDSGRWRGVVVRHCPQLATQLDALDDSFKPIIYAYRDVALRRLVSERVVFIGDAAHSMSPLLGQGARMALLDASMLTESLDTSGDLSTALRAFDQRARMKVAEFQRISRWLTPIFHSENRMFGTVRSLMQAAHRIPLVAAGARELLIGH